jgi:hypothetical protein
MSKKFLLDGMLGSLARWMRICGYDAEYRRDMDDDSLMEEAMETERILLTRDKTLVERSKKLGIKTIYVSGESIVDRLRRVRDECNINLEPVISRCPKCNGILEEVEEEEIRAEIPPVSLDIFDHFWKCSSCGSVFWKGSHWDNIKQVVSQIDRDCQ